jgi:polyisoprenoid-binding protein YceI
MKKFVLAAAVAAAVALPAVAELETYSVDVGHTRPEFEVRHLGLSIQRGRFDKVAGKINFDAAAKKGSADITIDTTSLDSGNAKLDTHLKSEDFFNVEKFPTMTFKGSNFTFDGDKLKSVGGDLTLLGVTKPVVLTANVFECLMHPMAKKKACGGDFSATLKRSDFGMKYIVGPVSDDVTLRVNIEALKD